MEKIRELASFFAVNAIVAFSIITAFYLFIRFSS
jgi:hypothetical protein